MHHSETLAKFVNERGFEYGAEIGVLQGRTFFHLLDHCPTIKRLVGVDLFRPRPGKSDGWSYEKDDLPAALKRINEQMAGYGERPMIMAGWSIECAGLWQEGTFDFVFIDGDHTWDGVYTDIWAWGRTVNNDTGWVIGHDYNPRFPDVINAVDQVFPGRKLLGNDIWAARRADMRSTISAYSYASDGGLVCEMQAGP